MITCREIAFGTRRNSADGERTKSPAIVPTPSLKLFLPRNWRQFFHRDDETYVAKGDVAPAVKTQQPLVSPLRDATIPDPCSSNALATPVWDLRLALEFPAVAVVLRGHDAG